VACLKIKLPNALCVLELMVHLHFQALYYYINENWISTLPHWDPLHGTQNEPCSAKFVYNAYGFQIGEPPSSTLRVFFTSPKHHLEFTKLAEIIETKGLKVLWNVKTRWISLLQSLNRVGKENKTLFVKMAIDNANVELAKAKLLNLCDIDMIFGLPCILPMFKFVNSLIKFAQGRGIFVCDYIATIKIC